jgi:hypothetical protein
MSNDARRSACGKGVGVVEVTYRNKLVDSVRVTGWMMFHSWLYGTPLIVLALIVTQVTWRAASGGPALLPFKIFAAVVFVVAQLAVIIALLLAVVTLAYGLSRTRGVYTEHTLTADEEGLTESTDVNTTTFKWEAVTKIVRTKRYLLIFLGSLRAHIIPRRDVRDQAQWDSTFQQLQELLAASRT